MKKTKRNIAIIVVLLFVCAAIYFNWSYNTQSENVIQTLSLLCNLPKMVLGY